MNLKKTGKLNVSGKEYSWLIDLENDISFYQITINLVNQPGRTLMAWQAVSQGVQKEDIENIIKQGIEAGWNSEDDETQVPFRLEDGRQGSIEENVEDIDEQPRNYWQPRVMHHRSKDDEDFFAIHEVYFTAGGDIDGYTQSALSPKEKSVQSLKTRLIDILDQNEDGIALGDAGYVYYKEEIELWLKHIQDPVIEYDEG